MQGHASTDWYYDPGSPTRDNSRDIVTDVDLTVNAVTAFFLEVLGQRESLPIETAKTAEKFLPIDAKLLHVIILYKL
ncbi:MAG: hypothetical protein LIQ30_11040, partial [Planctomycetes bacterium]|nr:hypothetical protein [Planctomycetota bacterium]